MTETMLKRSAEAEQAPRFQWHWQNLNDHKDGTQGSGLRHGRAWCHFLDRGANSRRTIEFCWNFWTHLFGFSFYIYDGKVTLMLALPPVALWLSFSANWAWIDKLLPRTALNARDYPGVIVIDERQCGLRIHDGHLYLNVWSKRNQSDRSDPWWVRGVSFNLNPFEWRFMRHEVRCSEYWPDGVLKRQWWEPFVGSWEVGQTTLNPPAKAADHRETFRYPYTYVLRSGTIQHRIATVYVERRAWRPLCLRWTGLIEKVSTCIDVQFDDEVGEQAGSWKGGTVRCGYALKPNETPLSCLRRMERERKF